MINPKTGKEFTPKGLSAFLYFCRENGGGGEQKILELLKLSPTKSELGMILVDQLANGMPVKETLKLLTTDDLIAIYKKHMAGGMRGTAKDVARLILGDVDWE